MHVNIDSNSIPVFLAHGGAATQIHGTLDGLRASGIHANFAHWWESSCEVDLLHFFGIPSLQYLKFAEGKNIPVISTHLLSVACNRTLQRMSLQGLGWSLCGKLEKIPIVGNFITTNHPEALRKCSICIVGLNAEREVLLRTYKVAEEKIHVIPLALGEAYFEALPVTGKKNWLITTGTITPQKRSLELAQMAHENEVPICFVGKPYDSNSQYWYQFKSLVDDRYVNYVSHTGSIEEMRQLLVSARGFVLYSDYENWSLSAHEAAACGLPLLLPKQAWSVERFGNQVAYFNPSNRRSHGSDLKRFFLSSTHMNAPEVEHLTWNQVSARLVEIYQDVLAKKT
jgi:glycosyltransferase involved in cell wall biosynthesis